MKVELSVSEAARVAAQRLAGGQLDSAEFVCRQVLSHAPGDPSALHLTGLIAVRRGRPCDAIDPLRRAVSAAPNDPVLHDTLGGVLAELGRPDEAVAAMRRAAALGPRQATFRVNLGNALLRSGLAGEAVATLRAAAELSPATPAVWTALGQAEFLAADPARSAAAFGRAADLPPGDPAAAGARLYALHYLDPHDPDALRAEHVRWAARYADPLTAAAPPPAIDGRRKPSGSRLRIGYLSPELRDHPGARFLLPVLRGHDRGRVELVCYADVPRPDAMTAACRAAADVWRDVAGLPDDRVADLIRADGVDVLVDATGHMAGGRPLVLARRPAPVQVLYPGYPSTTGMSAVGWCLTDDDRDPPGAERWYVEQLVRLPGSAQAYDPGTDLPPVADPPSDGTGGAVTFGCVNNPAKLTKPTLAAWARVLAAVPRSRLLLLGAGRGEPVGWVADWMADRGVGGDRVEWLPRVGRAAYLAAHARVDVALDPSPYAGHTTTLDAAWMGVPTVTRYGPSHLTREGYATNRALGLGDLSAADTDGYVAAAVALAGDDARRRALRRSLRDRLAASPLSNGRQVASGLEEALLAVWRDAH